ncbi:MAG: HAD-IB family hydrolase [Ornithinimicrobium sp.]
MSTQLDQTTAPKMAPLQGFTAPLVVWDVDRSLTFKDTLLPFLAKVVGPGAWPGVLTSVSAHTAARGGGRAGLKKGLLQRCLAGRAEAEVQEVAHEFARTIETQMCRRDALARWAWHHRRGHRLALASASLDLYLQPLGHALGAERVLATGLQVEDGRFTGAMSTANCRGAEKARRINELIEATRPVFVWIYSDSRSDQPSLDLADVPIRVSQWRPLRTPITTTHLRLVPEPPHPSFIPPGGTP